MPDGPTAPDDTVRRLVASGGVLFAGMVLQLGLGFLARLLVARWLGRVDYGAVSIGLTVLTVVTVLVVVGTDTGVGRFLPRYDDPARRRGVLTAAVSVVVPLSAAAGIAVAVLAGPLATVAFEDPSTAPVIRAFGLAVPFAAVLRLAVGSARGMGQSLPKVGLQNVLLPVVRVVLVVGALLAGFRSVGVAWAYAGAYAVVAAVAVAYLVRRTPLLADAPTRPMGRELLAFSAPLMVTAMMNVVFQNVDTLLLGVLATTGDVGVYNVAYPLATLLTVALTAFGFLFMPVISGLHADGRTGEMARTYEVVSKWILFATLPGVLALASHPRTVIVATFGREYVAGGLALAVLAVGVSTHAVTGPSGNVLTALGRSRTIMADNTAVVLVNVALNLVLIPRYPLLGAAAATAVGYALMNALYLVQLYRSTGMHPFGRALLAPGLAAVAVWAALVVGLGPVLPSGLPTLLVELGVFLACYPVVILRFGGVEAEDAAVLVAVEDRLGIDLGGVRTVARRLAS